MFKTTKQKLASALEANKTLTKRNDDLTGRLSTQGQENANLRIANDQISKQVIQQGHALNSMGGKVAEMEARTNKHMDVFHKIGGLLDSVLPSREKVAVTGLPAFLEDLLSSGVAVVELNAPKIEVVMPHALGGRDRTINHLNSLCARGQKTHMERLVVCAELVSDVAEEAGYDVSTPLDTGDVRKNIMALRAFCYNIIDGLESSHKFIEQ